MKRNLLFSCIIVLLLSTSLNAEVQNVNLETEIKKGISIGIESIYQKFTPSIFIIIKRKFPPKIIMDC